MFKIVIRDSLNQMSKIRIRAIAVIIALVITGVFVALLGKNPFSVYYHIVTGAFGSAHRVRGTINETIPLLITSLGIMIAFKMKFWNIGAEGQILAGAFAASYFALYYNYLPKIILLPVMFIAAFIVGGFWALIPAYFKARFGSNETILTLMFNYIAIKFVIWLQFGPWKDKNALGFPEIPSFEKNAVLPKIFTIHAGWIIAIVLTVIIYYFMKHSKKGYEIAVIGESEDTARYAGINIKGVTLLALLLSGGIAGVAGMIQASGVSRTLTADISGGYGYTAIITAWLSGLNPIYCSIVTFLFAMLIQGGTYIQTKLGISSAVSDIIQGMILFCILGSEFFIRYRVVKSSNFKKGSLADHLDNKTFIDDKESKNEGVLK